VAVDVRPPLQSVLDLNELHKRVLNCERHTHSTAFVFVATSQRLVGAAAAASARSVIFRHQCRLRRRPDVMLLLLPALPVSLSSSRLCEPLQNPVLNETKIRLFTYILDNPEDEDVQRNFWTDHAPLQRVEHPFANCIHKFNGCFPQDPAFVRCSSAPGANRAAVGNQTGTWPVCLPLLPQPARWRDPRRLTSSERRPLFYSFGIAGEWYPDDRLGALGYDVHSFDPTSKFYAEHSAHRARGVSFHYMGLKSNLAHCSSQRNITTLRSAELNAVYGDLGGELRTLADIRQQLGHHHRHIAAFKIDCEGCEWDAFYEMSRTEPHALNGVAMIVMELHQVMELKMANEADMRKFQEFFEYIFERQGFRFFYLHHNGGLTSVPQTTSEQRAASHERKPARYTILRKMYDLGATRNRCCFEIGLVKPSMLQKLLATKGQLSQSELPNTCWSTSAAVREAGLVFITSFGSSWYKNALANRTDTVFEFPATSPLVVYHEDIDEEIVGATCKVDLRLTAPWLRHTLRSNSSGFNAYNRLATYADPFNPFPAKGSTKASAVLMLKVAAISHAVHNARDGTVVFWIDTDVSFRSPVPSAAEVWLRERDVTYIPFSFGEDRWLKYENATSAAHEDFLLRQQWWRIESGLFALTANQRVRRFAKKATELYRGLMYEWARKCFQGSRECYPEYVRNNVFLNDAQAYSLILHSDVHKNSGLFSASLKHGWFAMRNYPSWRGHVWGNGHYKGAREPSQRKPSLVTPFHIQDYVFHYFGYHMRGALSEQNRGTVTYQDAWRRVDTAPDFERSLLNHVFYSKWAIATAAKPSPQRAG